MTTGTLAFHRGQLVLVGHVSAGSARVTVLETMSDRLARLDDLRPIGGVR